MMFTLFVEMLIAKIKVSDVIHSCVCMQNVML